MTVYIGFEGLMRIAERNGLDFYTVAFGPGEDGLECVATLRWKGKVQEFRATRNEAILDGRVTSKVWDEYPEIMLRRYTVGKAIEEELKEEVERVKAQAEGRLV